ncbi:BLUF domain-containing protein [Ideonella sp.]|uniref:BLUF domain-containing protein n=1 Tax=Ideonella sp. TaxID=1929293 RepID=UPI003BB6F466
MLVQLTYASRPSSVFTPDDLASILTTSQRNNARVGVTGVLCLINGIFLQQLEGDRTEVNRLYHRIVADPRHRDPALLDFAEIIGRRFTSWDMGSLAPVAANRQIFHKYSRSTAFDPYSMSSVTLQAFFAELLANGEWIA